MAELFPDRDEIRDALAAAAAAHHGFENDFLGGQTDDAWVGWYTAFVLGRLGPFLQPSALARLLESAPEGEDWSSSAADYVTRMMAN